MNNSITSAEIVNAVLVAKMNVTDLMKLATKHELELAAKDNNVVMNNAPKTARNFASALIKQLADNKAEQAPKQLPTSTTQAPANNKADKPKADNKDSKKKAVHVLSLPLNECFQTSPTSKVVYKLLHVLPDNRLIIQHLSATYLNDVTKDNSFVYKANYFVTVFNCPPPFDLPAVKSSHSIYQLSELAKKHELETAAKLDSIKDSLLLLQPVNEITLSDPHNPALADNKANTLDLN